MTWTVEPKPARSVGMRSTLIIAISATRFCSMLMRDSTKPVQDQQAAVVSERLEGIDDEHIAKWLSHDTVAPDLEGTAGMDKLEDRYDIDAEVLFGPGQ